MGRVPVAEILTRVADNDLSAIVSNRVSRQHGCHQG